MKPACAPLRVVAALAAVAATLAVPLTGSAVAATRLHTAAYSLQTVRDTADGFKIGVPAGWDVSTLGGTVVASKDASGHEVSIVYPAVLTSRLKPSTYFNSYLGYLKKLLSAGGTTFSYTVTSKSGQLPAAAITIHTAGTTLAGHAMTTVTADPTAHGSSMIAVRLYWAPQAQLAGQKAELAGIGTSFASLRAGMYTIVHAQGDPYTYAKAPGWHDAGENQDQLLLSNANGTASVLYWLGITQSSNAGSAAGLQALMFRIIGVSVTKVLVLDQLPTQTVSNGDVQTTQYEEFLGTYKGNPLHGIVGVVADNGGGVTSGVMRLGLSATGLWDSTNGALLHMAGSIQHDFTQDIETWDHITQQWQLEGQTFQAIDNAIVGVDLMKDPNTGQAFEAPYNSFNANGPAGPGYYNGSTKLVPATSW
ncbi:MAG TPA: hypothetical protein VFB34_07775 [Chloroflexota bacterium]|nr:hypothetical protein [Chloroflexota bacterium]